MQKNTICRTIEQAEEWFLTFRECFCIVEYNGTQAEVSTYPEAVAFFKKAQ